MKKACISAIIFASTMLMALLSDAAIRTESSITYSVLSDGESGPKYLSLTIPTPTASATSIIYAELQFESKIGSGVEVELWTNIGEGKKPWEAEEPNQRSRWTTDGGSGDLVRFDVTEFVQGWLSGKENKGFLIRLVPGQDAQDLILASQPKLSLKYHEVSRTAAPN